MAEEEVVVDPSPGPESSLPSSDNKRKFEDVESETIIDLTLTNHHSTDADSVDGVPASDSSDAKRPRLDDEENNLKPDGLGNENGFKLENSGEPANEEETHELGEQKEENEQKADTQSPPEEPQVQTKQASEEEDNNINVGVSEQAAGENAGSDIAQDPSKEENFQPSEDFPQDAHGNITRKMEVPNNKVGVLIGKAGDTIKSLQNNSGAKIQITRDAEADPHSTTRPVEIIGDLASIEKAEVLIKAVIAEAEAGGSPSLVARGRTAGQPTFVSEQIEMRVANEKVGLIIGKGGETIKGLQGRSGARIQLIPQHLSEGDGSQERIVRISGDRKQIEMANVMIKDVMNQTLKPSSLSGGFNQQGYNRPRGPPGPGHWGSLGPQRSYGYHQHGSYPPQNHRYQPPNHGGYPPQQMTPRSNFVSDWDRPPPQSGGCDYYNGQGGHPGSGPGHMQGHNHGPSPAAMGPPPSQANYNYGQPQGPDYGHQAHYSHPQESYEQNQHPYGGQEVYTQQQQPGYGPQQYGKPPSYSVPQGPPTMYGPPRASQPGDAQYQTAAQSYGSNVPTQSYPYASSGPTQQQQTYPPYGSTPARTADGYNQQPPASGGQGYAQQGTQPVPGYAQQGTQPVPSYGQPAGQQTSGYGQVAPAAGYGAYPSAQQGYTEQTAPNNAGYGYQAPQDPAYGTGAGSAYGGPASGQPNYAQPAPTQPSYDQTQTQTQTVPQPGGYGAVPVSTQAAAYAKTVSPQPQPAYAQYDANQMYAGPR